AVTSWAGLDLVRGNAVKVLTILCFTILSLSLFAWQGQVSWSEGGILALGTAAGGQVGTRLTVLKGSAWVRGVVIGAVLVFAVLLWFR
ncbi:MAG: sulfite exporter TauE/SafE family protein, partial [Thermoanaerobaculia bacterium]|nr:sulfite exporter TauE/SafE family protein [Thermoanaerobaculia bacterium]